MLSPRAASWFGTAKADSDILMDGRRNSVTSVRDLIIGEEMSIKTMFIEAHDLGVVSGAMAPDLS